jgi:hypothetical protein
VHKDGATVRIYSRSLEEMTDAFPEIARGVTTQIAAQTAIIEGEALAYHPASDEYLPFQQTMRRRRKHGIAEAAATLPLRLFAFDVLYADGERVAERPYAERHALLRRLIHVERQPGRARRDPVLRTGSPSGVLAMPSPVRGSTRRQGRCATMAAAPCATDAPPWLRHHALRMRHGGRHHEHAWCRPHRPGAGLGRPHRHTGKLLGNHLMDLLKAMTQNQGMELLQVTLPGEVQAVMQYEVDKASGGTVYSHQRISVRRRLGSVPAPRARPRRRGRPTPRHAHLGRTQDAVAQPIARPQLAHHHARHALRRILLEQRLMDLWVERLPLGADPFQPGPLERRP